MGTTDRAFDPAALDAFAAVDAAFGALGRVCMGLDSELRLRHASELLDGILGDGAAAAMIGRPIAELLGDELFGESGQLRRALVAGERREGWRGSLRLPGGDGERATAPRACLVSVTAAPLVHDREGACDLDTRYIVVVRRADEEPDPDGAPTGFGGIIARSPAMLRVIRIVDDLRDSEATVLLTGESGTGKEVVARALHGHSPRRAGPLVAVHCGALPAEVLEAELFGGAARDRASRFEQARAGTLFLDEIAELPAPLQIRLVRLLHERSLESDPRQAGASDPRHAGARIIAATNADLRRAIGAGTFNADLFYRLRGVPIELPPLRDRRPDIEPLAHHLLCRVAARSGRALRFSPDAMRALLAHDWPGNVRELESALGYAVSVCHGQTLLPEDLPAELRAGEAPVAVPASDGERTSIRAALEAHDWSRNDVARALGMSRTTLWRKMRELGLHRQPR